MAKWLRLYSDLPDDPKIGTLTDSAFRVWVELLCNAKKCEDDRYRNGECNVTYENSNWVMRKNNAEEDLKELESRGLIEELESGNLRIVSWDKRQFKSDDSNDRVRKHRKNKKKKNCDGDVTLQKKNCNGDVTAGVTVETKSVTGPLCKTETETETETDPPPQSPKKPPDKFIDLLLNTGEKYPVTNDQVREWAALFPSVDVPQQLRNMLAWCQSNPTKRKTKRGISRFVASWLTRVQDQGPLHGKTNQHDNRGSAQRHSDKLDEIAAAAIAGGESF